MLKKIFPDTGTVLLFVCFAVSLASSIMQISDIKSLAAIGTAIWCGALSVQLCHKWNIPW
jgi:hypothetical protein